MLSFASVPRVWPEATILCLGSGPSLSHDDIAYISHARICQPQLRVIAVNDTFTLVPWADVLYAPDEQWWRWHGAEVASWFPGRKYTLHPSPEGERAGAQLLNFRSGGGLSDDPSCVQTGGHGGFQAINVAVHLGAKRIGLLGYDLQASPTGINHYFGEHPDGSHVPYDEWRDIYDTLIDPCAARGITIVNCSRRTAITAFPRMTVQEFLHADSG